MGQEGDFVLPKSGLCIRDGCLLKETAESRVIARHALPDIERAELVKMWDLTGFVLVPLAAGLAAVAWIYIPWAGWRWAVALVLWGLAGIFITGLRDPKLRVHTRHGCVNYALKDEADEVQGFVVTLCELVAQHSSRSVGANCAAGRTGEH